MGLAEPRLSVVETIHQSNCFIDCTVAVISYESFFQMIDNYPELKNRLKKHSYQYDDHWKQYKIRAISDIEYFSNLHQLDLEVLNHKLEFANFEAGAKVFSLGSQCQKLYLIVKGELEIYLDQNGKEYTLDTLGPKAILGRYSVLTQEIFEFSARATTNLIMLTLSQNDLIEGAEECSAIQQALDSAINKLTETMVPALDYTMVYYPTKLENEFLKMFS